uniref:Non-SMC condensin I complex subunit G n=1 Tax=Leptobrachium leishanense TaxID=445787 RepID=A0A8C5LK80_9ANUR
MAEEKKKSLQIKEAFDLAQKPHQNHAKLVSSLRATYDKMEDKSIFLEEFIHYIKYPLIVYRREPSVERVMDFVAKFVTSFHKPESEDDDYDEMDEENSPVNFLFTFLLQSHTANSMAVRFRVCQLVNKLLVNLPENAQIDDDLFDKIHDAMLTRAKDRVPNVRIQAVLALARLQDPTDPNCPVSNAYMLLLENDTNAEVRRAVLSCIAPSAQTLPKIVSRTMDVKDLVRKLAYQVLAEKVHLRALSIAQRVRLLQQGLNDRSEAVKEMTQKKLIQSWLRYTEGDVLELLHRLDVENSPEVAVSALNAMFSVSPLNELVQNCKNIDERKLILVETLTPENVLYWKALCEYLKSKDDEGEEALENILPEPAVYAEYLSSYLRNLPVLSEEQRADLTKIEDLMTKEFIGQQLIHIIGCLDTTEEGGRKRLISVLQEILVLPNTPTSLISSLVELLLRIIKDDDRRILTVAEIISELREPIVTIEKPADHAATRKRQLKLADVKVQLIETKQALEDSINLQDFALASELKEKVAELEKLKTELNKEIEQPEIKEVRVEKNDPETLLKCLIMCNELLKHLSLSKGVGGTLNEIIESLILPGITNVHPSVRNMAVLCIGCCALQNIDFARRHLPLLLQVPEIRTETAEGLAKLMFSGRLISAKLLSRLVLLWYNPVTEEDTKLRHCLGVFFPIFAYSCRASQECFEEAFFPTLTTLFNAPATSPLADVDVANVAELLVDLTRPSGINTKNKQELQAPSVHDSLALKICNEILQDPVSPDVRIYAKCLSSLEFTKDYNEDLLLALLDSVLQDVTDKVCERAIEKVKMQFKNSKNLREEPVQETEGAAEQGHNEEEADTDVFSEQTVDTPKLKPKKGKPTTAGNKKTVSDEQNPDTAKRPAKGKATTGRRKGSSTTTARRKATATKSTDVESGSEKPEEPAPVNTRPSRRAKTAAMAKTKMNLSKLLNEAN